MKVFLDTNIIVDFLGKREPFFTPASKVIEMSKRGMFDLVVSSLSFVNAAYILRKKFDRQTLDNHLLHLMGVCRVSKVDEDVIMDAILDIPFMTAEEFVAKCQE